jgi:hypothetical protein
MPPCLLSYYFLPLDTPFFRQCDPEGGSNPLLKLEIASFQDAAQSPAARNDSMKLIL